MPLTLTVRSVERSGAAAPPPLRLEGRGAVIGRAPGTDWTLPDDRNTVSSRHCEIAFRDGAYLLADTSTNGTSVNGRRLASPHRLSEGDVIGIGPYSVVAAITPDGAVRPHPPAQRTQAPSAGMASAPPASAAAEQLLGAAGLSRADVASGDAELLAAAGTVLREMAAGTATLLERRARARAELGIAAGAAGGGGPLEGRAALATLLASSSPERAVRQAFADLEAHQLAALQAMHGAMKATLERISPSAIRARGGATADAAALWEDYERGFAAGDDGFVEVFAREFRSACDALSKRR